MKTTENLIWMLLWAVMLTALLIGQYEIKQTRDIDRHHAEVLASELWPSTASSR